MRVLQTTAAMSLIGMLACAIGAAAQDAPTTPQIPDRAVAKDFRKIVDNKVLVLNYDPIIESHGGKRLHQVLGWNDPHQLAVTCAADIRECSRGDVRPRFVGWHDVDEFPQKKDGYQYTDEEYLDNWYSGGGWHEADAVDYNKIIDDWNVAQLVESGAVDEVWLFGAPYFGYWESTMAGDGAYWCNSPPVGGVDCSKIFVVTGYNYERGVDCMLEDFGHRAESILTHVFGSWNGWPPQHDWDRFTLYDKIAPGEAACGNVHYAPNSDSDYDWGNPRYVWSTCDDWLSYPDLTGDKIWVNRTEWGNGDMRLHHKWWFLHFPHALGRTEGKLNHWWYYVFDYNAYDESNH
jgi:hypothetical protein